MYLLFVILEKYPTDEFHLVISIFKEACLTDEFLLEVLRVLLIRGQFVVYESAEASGATKTATIEDKRLRKLKLSGFIQSNPLNIFEKYIITEEKPDKDLVSKSLLLKLYPYLGDICKVAVNKPSFQVNYMRCFNVNIFITNIVVNYLVIHCYNKFQHCKKFTQIVFVSVFFYI